MTIRRIPKVLQEYAARHSHQVREITWSDGYGSERGGAYDAVLQPGWRKCDEYVHTLINATAAGLIAELVDIIPCDCEECRRKA